LPKLLKSSTFGCKQFGMDSVLPYSIHCPSRFTYITHMGSLLENESSCRRSVHSTNTSNFRFFWKAFVCNVPYLPRLCTPFPLNGNEGSLSFAATLSFLKDGDDVLFATIFAMNWNRKDKRPSKINIVESVFWVLSLFSGKKINVCLYIV